MCYFSGVENFSAHKRCALVMTKTYALHKLGREEGMRESTTYMYYVWWKRVIITITIAGRKNVISSIGIHTEKMSGFDMKHPFFSLLFGDFHLTAVCRLLKINLCLCGFYCLFCLFCRLSKKVNSCLINFQKKKLSIVRTTT